MRWRWLNILVLTTLVSGMLAFAGPESSVAAAASETPTLQSSAAPYRLSADRNDGSDLQLESVSVDDLIIREPLVKTGGVLYEERDATGPATYIIELEAQPVASYRGGVPGLVATSPSVTGVDKLSLESTESQEYLTYLADERDQVLTQMRQRLGRTVRVLHTYDVAYYGMAVELTPDEASRVAQLPGVARVIRNFVRYPQTDTSPEYLNAVGIWDGTNTGVLSGTMGEGVLVGIIDTGINMDHPSFADVGDDGYDHTNPLGSGNYTGWCDPTNDSYDDSLVCNDKLIGVYSYTDSGNDPEDDNSHGSHTASTTAGNVVISPTLPAGVVFDQMSGMAPHANIIAYDVCTDDGCWMSAITAAIDDAVADGVDVINYSIGGDPTSPWDDPDSLSFLAARDAGVFVATSAGNDGPAAGTLGSPGNSPWMTTVANGTHNRGYAANGIVDMEGGTPPADITGAGVSGEYGPARIVYAGDYGNALCGSGSQDSPTNPFVPGTWTGQIVVCDRGTYYLVDKAAHVLAAGAGGVIIANTSATGAQIYQTDLGMPGTHVTYVDGQSLRTWLVDSDTNIYTATITASPIVHSPSFAGILAEGSSRGPNIVADFIKPDIVAPGTNILAAYAGDADAFGLMSGTSMASPHVAGAAALMRALYPDWTVAEIESALMMTSATGDLYKDDGVTPADPFDVGAGRLDLTGAALAGLVLDETTENFEAADPGEGGDPTALNRASLASDQCLFECSWERTFRNTTGTAVTWELSFGGDVVMSANPVSFTIAAGGTQVVEFTADVSAEEDGEWLFGKVILTADGTTLPVQHLPVAVMPSSGILPDLVEINTRRNAGSQMVEGLQSIEISDLTVASLGLTEAAVSERTLAQHSLETTTFPDIFFVDEVLTETVVVSSGSPRLVAAIFDTTSADLDMLVIHDANGNGVPDYADTTEQHCQSAASGPWEQCDIADPMPGVWFVMVVNYDAVNDPDSVSLGTAAVAGTDIGNMVVVGPDSVAAMTPFDLQVFWDIPEMVAGDRWYGAFSLGTDAGNVGNIGTIPVDLIRHDDDVVKTANADSAVVGDTITYTIAVMPNVTPEDLTYMITDTIPAGLTYVPGSAVASEGTVNVTGNSLTWSGTMSVPSESYLMTTSLTDLACSMPLTTSGAYLNLQGYGVSANPGISGDSTEYLAFTEGDPLTYWGNAHTGIYFTDDGMAYFDSTSGTSPWVNQDIPNAEDPNNLLAMFWNDWEIVYDLATNRGVSLATLGGATGAVVIEYDDVQPYGVPGETVDFEVLMWRTPDRSLGDPDIIFAYDNIALATPIDTGTIGIENASGTEGVKYAYDDTALQTLQDGMAICYDWYQTANPVVITYQVTVDALESTLTNTVVHSVDNEGSVPADSSFDLTIVAPYRIFLPLVSRG